MATKKKAADTNKDAEKAAKKKARMEALKNRPAGQRQNSKTIDIIATENGGKVINYAHVVKAGNRKPIGVLITSVAYDADGNVIGTSTAFVAGQLSVKCKKGHGNFAKPKSKNEPDDEEEEETEED